MAETKIISLLLVTTLIYPSIIILSVALLCPLSNSFSWVLISSSTDWQTEWSTGSTQPFVRWWSSISPINIFITQVHMVQFITHKSRERKRFVPLNQEIITIIISVRIDSLCLKVQYLSTSKRRNIRYSVNIWTTHVEEVDGERSTTYCAMG